MKKKWTVEEVRNVLPLVRSIILSIREHLITANGFFCRRRKIEKADKLSRDDMVLASNLANDEEYEDQKIEEALKELSDLGAYCVNPSRAIVAFRFLKKSMDNGRKKRTAWILYSPYGEELYWRFNGESEDIRHDIKELTRS
jgi:hypothetical protein